MRNKTTKYLLKKSLEPELPHQVLYRKKKGFGIPISEWLLDEKAFQFKNNSPMLDQDFINNELAGHRQKKKNSKAFLWNLYVLENNFATNFS
ncbi:MAG: hypothetical protein HOM21_01815 [Halobacteriovoraceae bacterium]|nr:hypothetical protein [Halobacteriovoraceae bacterium]